MDYEKLATPKSPAYEKWRDDHLAWVYSDCRNKFCIAGGVYVEEGEYTIAYQCPVCGRYPAPIAAIYKGPIELFSDEEIERRLKDRKNVYFDKEYRYKRGIEVMRFLHTFGS
jgi:hypothetical protein